MDEATKAIQEQIDSMACTVSQNKVLRLLFALTQHFFCRISTRDDPGPHSLLPNSNTVNSVQEAVREAQEKLAKQKEVIMAQDKELKVEKTLFFSVFFFPYSYL